MECKNCKKTYDDFFMHKGLCPMCRKKLKKQLTKSILGLVRECRKINTDRKLTPSDKQLLLELSLPSIALSIMELYNF